MATNTSPDSSQGTTTPPPGRFSKTSARIEGFLNGLGEILFLVLLCGVVWKVVWGLVARPIVFKLVLPMIESMMDWPTWLRMTVGLPTALVLCAPFILLLYWLFNDLRGVAKIAEMRHKDPVKQVLDPLRKGLYCLALYAALKFVWLAPVNQSLETTDWWGMLRQLLTQF